jgi:hypothetical protein
MTNFIIIITVVLCISGIGFAIWSILDTRNKYYNDYVSRKRRD